MKRLICTCLLALLLLSACTDNKPKGSESEAQANESTEFPWQDEENIPDLNWSIDIPEYSNNGEDGEGVNGDDWELPEWEVPSQPFTTEDLNIPELPVNLEYSMPDFPIDLEYSAPDFPTP